MKLNSLKTMMVSRSLPQLSILLQRKSGIVLVCLLVGVIGFLQISTTSELIHRILSSSTPYEQCEVFSITVPSQPIIPIYAASYPGSGSQMTHYLFEAITGLEAGDEHHHRGDKYDMITIKTHFPARPHNVEGNRMMTKVILLLRNPLYSIPSYHNFLYEEENDIPNHTMKAPVESWIKWRDDHVYEEIAKWRDHTEYWLQQYNRENRLVIAFERLTNNKMGPVESTRISNFLSRQDGVDVVSPSKIPCVWDKVVNYNRIDIDEHGNEISKESARKLVKKQNEKVVRHLYTEDAKKLKKSKAIVKRRVKYVSREDPTHPAHSKRSGNQKYDFTKEQLLQLRSMLNRLRGKYLNEYTFVVIVSGYIEEIDEELKKL